MDSYLLQSVLESESTLETVSSILSESDLSADISEHTIHHIVEVVETPSPNSYFYNFTHDDWLELLIVCIVAGFCVVIIPRLIGFTIRGLIKILNKEV